MVFKMRILIFFAIPLIVSCSAMGGSCNPWRDTKVSSIKLQENDFSPAFYFRAAEYYVIRLNENDDHAVLELNFDKRGVPALLGEIKNDLPLKMVVDLFTVKRGQSPFQRGWRGV
jgi:hypothetical protein